FRRTHLLFRRTHLLFRRTHLLFRRTHLLFRRTHLLFRRVQNALYWRVITQMLQKNVGWVDVRKPNLHLLTTRNCSFPMDIRVMRDPLPTMVRAKLQIAYWKFLLLVGMAVVVYEIS
ncbi:hypothetical protein, partial [uncultured Nostoc sp.]|uniref:hypothetical protein n=1 Tax=uncultured Nostoc sp. TaxID=340711 RepID=UPI0035CAE9F0